MTFFNLNRNIMILSYAEKFAARLFFLNLEKPVNRVAIAMLFCLSSFFLFLSFVLFCFVFFYKGKQNSNNVNTFRIDTISL